MPKESTEKHLVMLESNSLTLTPSDACSDASSSSSFSFPLPGCTPARVVRHYGATDASFSLLSPVLPLMTPVRVPATALVPVPITTTTTTTTTAPTLTRTRASIHYPPPNPHSPPLPFSCTLQPSSHSDSGSYSPAILSVSCLDTTGMKNNLDPKECSIEFPMPPSLETLAELDMLNPPPSPPDQSLLDPCSPIFASKEACYWSPSQKITQPPIDRSACSTQFSSKPSLDSPYIHQLLTTHPPQKDPIESVEWSLPSCIQAGTAARPEMNHGHSYLTNRAPQTPLVEKEKPGHALASMDSTDRCIKKDSIVEQFPAPSLRCLSFLDSSVDYESGSENGNDDNLDRSKKQATVNESCFFSHIWSSTDSIVKVAETPPNVLQSHDESTVIIPPTQSQAKHLAKNPDNESENENESDDVNPSNSTLALFRDTDLETTVTPLQCKTLKASVTLLHPSSPKLNMVNSPLLPHGSPFLAPILPIPISPYKTPQLIARSPIRRLPSNRLADMVASSVLANYFPMAPSGQTLWPHDPSLNRETPHVSVTPVKFQGARLSKPLPPALDHGCQASTTSPPPPLPPPSPPLSNLPPADQVKQQNKTATAVDSLQAHSTHSTRENVQSRAKQVLRTAPTRHATDLRTHFPIVKKMSEDSTIKPPSMQPQPHATVTTAVTQEPSQLNSASPATLQFQNIGWAPSSVSLGYLVPCLHLGLCKSSTRSRQMIQVGPLRRSFHLQLTNDMAECLTLSETCKSRMKMNSHDWRALLLKRDQWVYCLAENRHDQQDHYERGQILDWQVSDTSKVAMEASTVSASASSCVTVGNFQVRLRVGEGERRVLLKELALKKGHEDET